MTKKPLSLVLVAFALALPTASAVAQPTAAKKVLVARILKVQQSGIESISRAMVERPAIGLLDAAGAELQVRVPADKREAMGKEMQADVKKFLDDAVPLVTSRAIRLAPTTIGALLEDKFTEDELKQIATFLEAPAINKYQRLNSDMQKALMEPLLAETRPLVDPKVAALEDTLAKRLGIVPQAAPAK